MDIRKQLWEIYNAIDEQYDRLGELGREYLNCPEATEKTVERANDALLDLDNALVCIGDLQYMDWPSEPVHTR